MTGAFETAAEIEIAIASMFNPRQNAIAPNVSWGFGLHECDLLIITKAGYAIEVEIKVTKSDIIADQKKRHHHHSNKIRKLYFAIPKKLEPHSDLIPLAAGIITVDYRGHKRITRAALPNRTAVKLEPKEVNEIYRLAALRIWGLKRKILALKGIQSVMEMDV